MSAIERITSYAASLLLFPWLIWIILFFSSILEVSQRAVYLGLYIALLPLIEYNTLFGVNISAVEGI